MPKIFKAGDIVQFENSKNHSQTDGLVLTAPYVRSALNKHFGWDDETEPEFTAIGLLDGKSYSVNSDTIVHTHRVKGLVKAKDEVEYPKKVDDEYSCTSQHPDVNYTGFHWSCEREVGHPGDHMAWQKYPHHLYEGGVWQQTKKVEAAQQADEVSVELNDDDIPF